MFTGVEVVFVAIRLAVLPRGDRRIDPFRLPMSRFEALAKISCGLSTVAVPEEDLEGMRCRTSPGRSL